MSTTFLEMTNRVLRHYNEVELTSTNFASVRGFHSYAKDAVNNAIDKINSAEMQWPFNHTSTTQLLVNGTQFYTLPVAVATVDWDSFFLQGSTALNVSSRPLPMIDYDHWMKSYRARDYDNTNGGVPDFVIRDQTERFGFTLWPDAGYTVAYEYWAIPTRLSAHSDTISVPDRFAYVIFDGALYWCTKFRDNEEAAQPQLKLFEKGIGNMRTQLSNKTEYMRDTRPGYSTSTFY